MFLFGLSYTIHFCTGSDLTPFLSLLYQCGEGLICWQRGFRDTVPGCTGDLESTTDYCVFAKFGAADDEGPDDGATEAPSDGDDGEDLPMDPTYVPTVDFDFVNNF